MRWSVEKSGFYTTIIQLVLENNYFKFENEFYLQKLGTAMGNSMAPPYAFIFMGTFEQDFLQKKQSSTYALLRFRDDIFMVLGAIL